MARERGLGREVHDCVRIARQQMAGDGETTGDVAETLPVLRVQEQRADAGRPNRRHGGTNNAIGTAASPKTAHSRGSGAGLASRVPTCKRRRQITRDQVPGYSPLVPSHRPYTRWRTCRDAQTPRPDLDCAHPPAPNPPPSDRTT